MLPTAALWSRGRWTSRSSTNCMPPCWEALRSSSPTASLQEECQLEHTEFQHDPVHAACHRIPTSVLRSASWVVCATAQGLGDPRESSYQARQL